MPKKVELSNSRSATFVYDAAGVKRKVTHQGGGINQTTDYCGNVIYENGVLSKILTEEGYITVSGTTPTYHYYLKDHLGNNRVVLNQDMFAVEQVNHYYPFGGLFDQTTENLQAYKYNGKELDRTHGIDLYDYSARYMDGALGRFTTMDPMAEKYYSISPYVYCANNPVIFIDPDGQVLNFFQWNSDGNGGGSWDAKQLSETAIKALEAFAKTKEGYAFLAKYAQKGQQIGSIKFDKSGEYSDVNMNLMEFGHYGGGRQAYRSNGDGDENQHFYIMFSSNTERTVEQIALTIGHEALIHTDITDDQIIAAHRGKKNNPDKFNKLMKEDRKNASQNGNIDHAGYINNDPKYNSFNRYVNQLKKILNLNSVNDAKKRHDKKYNNLRK